MKRIDRAKIKESSEELRKLMKQQKHPRFFHRINMLVLLKENPDTTLKELTKVIPFNYRTLRIWWKKYERGGIEGLLDWKVTGYRGKMNEEQLQEFMERVNSKGFGNQKEMIEWIYERFGIVYSQQGISDLLKRMKVKKKVGRSVNVKKDEEREEEFKKREFKEIVKSNPGKEIFFLTNHDLD